MDEFEIQVAKIKGENEKYLEMFAHHLESQGLKNKTINRHVFNVDFYINDYLCYYEPLRIDQGSEPLHHFFSSWFIRKAMWSSKATINSTAASIKKFYKFMAEAGIVKPEVYQEIAETIKTYKELWYEYLEEYESGGFSIF
ncbi:MAG: hypothetical protein PHI41_06525 [Erysipelotrichaceae bacterium]|nr:hypothetical protein [Erysipelotrichaceae bacterium]MDD3810215.1 hypothetical protein [Erysipelotrichaceae bacterium]